MNAPLLTFTVAEIVPLPAVCKKCRAEWIDGNGNGAIRAPSLRNCLCFYCGGQLLPHPGYPDVVDALSRRTGYQAVLPIGAERSNER